MYSIQSPLPFSRHTTWVKAEALAYFKSSKQCAEPQVLTTNTKSLVGGKLGLTESYRTLPTLTFSVRHGDVPDLTADPSLAEKELGFKAPADLETMCQDLWNWQSKHPQGYGEL